MEIVRIHETSNTEDERWEHKAIAKTRPPAKPPGTANTAAKLVSGRHQPFTLTKRKAADDGDADEERPRQRASL